MEAMEMSEVYEDVKTTEEVESCCSIMEVTSPKKRKSRSPEDMTDKPKKPRSAYLLYYFDVHQIMQQESPNLPQSEINKRISESWKRLSVAEKGYYLEKAKLEKDGVDTSSLGHAQDLPGFRKILPRANCVLLRKGSSSMAQAARSQPDVCGEPLDSAVDGGPPSLSLPQEPKFSSLAPGGEVELAEQCIAVKALAEDAAAVSHATDVHGVPPPSCPSSSKSPAQVTGQAPAHNSQGAPGLLLRGSDVRVAGAGYSIFKMTSEEVGTGGAVVQPVQGETAQVVTLIPAQNLVEPKSLSSANSVGSVMMVSVGANVEQTSKPTYKMAVKTYTRRGRGRCLAPGCSFVYVTRHKPPTCPECGNYLGGKWVPGAKKTSGKDAAAQQQKAETKANNTCQPKPCSTEGKDSTSSNANGSRARKEGCGVQVPRKQHAVMGRAPLEGGSTKTQSQLKPLKAAAKGLAVKGQDKSYTAVKKRPVRPILPAYCTAGRTLLQFITLPPDKGKAGASNNKSTTVPSENTSGLKPSTLKQLGHSVSTAMAQQNSAGQPTGPNLTSLVDKGVNVLSVVPFKQNISSFDLGLSTARGRGRCKNPSCDYVYKNRHKPAQCPKCGWELAWKNTKGSKAATLLDPYQALSPAQRDIQRQSTLQLLRQGLQFPESEAELQDTLALIQELNGHQVVLTQSGGRGGDAANSEAETEAPAVLSGWSQFYESAATHCGLCQYPLFKGGQSTVAGQEDCWLLTETLIQTASLQLKVCLNTQCLALHSFTDLHAGLFNIGNRLLVSLDLFLKIRAKIKLGHHPAAAARTILDHVSNHPVHALSPEESSQVWELLLSGYWAFECLTVRDYNDMICGVCGVAPKLEVAQRFTHNVLEFRNVEFTWPEFSGDEVHVDDFWMAMESEAVEQAAFPSDVPITQVDASIIAPFIPPLMRSPTVINTEKDKVLPGAQQPSGDPALLVRLIHEGQLRLDQIEEHTEDELRAALESCGESRVPESSKDELLASLIALYVHIQNGLPTGPPPPANRTAGKLSKVCPHKVVCGSKYMVRGETARDHVDLLLSSRYWPPVYVADCARQVALCADVQYPELASQMWGRNQGCFSDPLEKPQLVSCAELQDQPYSADHPSAFAAMAAGGEQDLVHPVTRSSSRWLVHPACEPPHLEHHSMGLCTELEPYGALVAELERGRAEAEGSDTEAGPSRPLVFDNTAYYYLYNRLVDFMSSRDIVSQQISQVLRACQPGEVVIRDALYRLGVAQINTEGEEGDVGDQCLEVHEHEGGLDGETIYEVVLP